MRRSVLHIEQILEWADAHFARTGRWPNVKSGRVREAVDEKWANINQALHKGLRGFRGGTSLPRLFAKHRGVRNRKGLPHYTLKRILSWADAHHVRTGRWPTSSSGPIAGAPGETWTAVAIALSHGRRGLPGGESLARLLAKHRRVRNVAASVGPTLTAVEPGVGPRPPPEPSSMHRARHGAGSIQP